MWSVISSWIRDENGCTFFWGQWRIRFVAVDRSPLFAFVTAGRENLIGRNDWPQCLLRLLVHPLPMDGSANVQTLHAGVSLPGACPAKNMAMVATTMDCKRCQDAASSPASSTIPPIKGPIALFKYQLILLLTWMKLLLFSFIFFCWGLFLFEWSSSHVQLLYRLPSVPEIPFRVVLHQCIPHT